MNGNSFHLKRDLRRHVLQKKDKILLHMLAGWSPSVAASKEGLNFSAHRKYLLEDEEFAEVHRKYKLSLRKKMGTRQYVGSLK